MNNWQVFALISETLFHEGRQATEFHELLFGPQMKVIVYLHVPIVLTERENAPDRF